VLIGTAVDELIRHHPTLKTPVFEAVKSALSKIEDLGNAFVIPEDKREWYGLTLASSTTDRNDVAPMDVVENEVSTFDAQEDSPEDDSPTTHDNNVVLFIDVICRVSAVHLLLGLSSWCFVLCSSLRVSFNIRNIARISFEMLTALSVFANSRACHVSRMTTRIAFLRIP